MRGLLEPGTQQHKTTKEVLNSLKDIKNQMGVEIPPLELDDQGKAIISNFKQQVNNSIKV